MTTPALRVAFCIDNMNPGGTELNALRTAPHLLAAGVELSVFSLSDHGPLLERYAAMGVRVDILPLRSLYGRSALTAGREMRRIIKDRGIGVVHAHDLYSNIFAGPWTRSAGAKFIASRRWWYGPDSIIQRAANRASYLLAHRILANSEGVARLLIRHEGVAPDKVVVIRNFVDESSTTAPSDSWIGAVAQDLGLPAERLVVGVVANLSPVKGHETLLDAVARLLPRWPSLYLVLVGRDAGSEPTLRTRAEALGIADRVRFAGYRPTTPSMHHLFDVSVLPSHSEGFPNTILEAMAAGRPVVASAVGAVPDAVTHGETGFLVPPGDVAALSAHLEELLGDPRLRTEFGLAGRSQVLAGYDSGTAISSLLELYRSLLTP